MQHHRFITCLTGRKEAYLDAEHFKDVTGYTNPNESKHDMFIIGHTSTSISLALGLAEGRDLNKEHENIIAVIGDGSLSGGEALELLKMVEQLCLELMHHSSKELMTKYRMIYA